jgi:hypothetical protein
VDCTPLLFSTQAWTRHNSVLKATSYPMTKSEIQHALREIHTLLSQAMANHDKNRGAIDELIDQAEEKVSALEDELAEEDDDEDEDEE